MSEENAAVELGTTELIELFDSLKLLGGFAGKVLKDGKVSTADFSYLIDLAIKFEDVVKGFSDLDKAVAEAKDLKKAELLLVISKVYEVVQAFEAGKKS
jgi:hypothetical protein